MEIEEPSDSYIPEPQSLERITPEIQPISPKNKEIDSMFNLILSENQEDKNKFAQEYVQRKVDRRIREIEGLSNEKKRRNYIEDAQIVLKNRISDEYTKGEKDYYQVYFSNTPDPAYLRGKADVMTDTEILKQRMKKTNINQKANEIVKDYFKDKKPARRKGKRKQKKGQDNKPAFDIGNKNEFYNTLDLRIGPDLTSNQDTFQRESTSTFENGEKFNSNLTQEDELAQIFEDKTEDRKERTIMQVNFML